MLRQGTALVLLWLAGGSLRLTILVLAPLLPLIHRDLGLNETAIGTLGSLPSLLFACAAIPGALLIARVGARRTLSPAFSSPRWDCAARRGIGHRGARPRDHRHGSRHCGDAAGTAAAVAQMDARSVGFATAVYSNGMVMAGILGVGAVAYR